MVKINVLQVFKIYLLMKKILLLKDATVEEEILVQINVVQVVIVMTVMKLVIVEEMKFIL